ncbi:MAG: enoyl-CoA hydratase/isomerase family protein [Bacteroidia bacterium]|nr:enoyl-CoA hydratase/isomerase family protein [Bacteroidia bacterium]
MEKIKLNYSHSGTVARITLAAEKGNILDSIMMNDLKKAFIEFAGKPEIKLLVFEGEGKHFSFGASVEEHKKEHAAEMLRSFHNLFYSIRDLAVPVVALVSGQCLGGGMEVALAANFIFADQSARFGQPEVVLGVFPPPASVILPEKIGLARAEELLLTGKSVTAAEAHQMGLVNKVFESKEAMNIGLEEFIRDFIAPRSASSLRFAVKASRAKFNHVLGNFLAHLEDMYVNELMETNDACEGINAFLEKRAPVWKNR